MLSTKQQSKQPKITLRVLFLVAGMEWIGFIFTFIGLIYSLEIQYDDLRNGIFYIESHQINLKEFNEFLYYTFDVSTVQYILSWKNNLRINCSENIDPEANDITWNAFIPEPELNDNRIKRVPINLSYINILNMNIATINSPINNSEECNTLREMSDNLKKLNYELNKLSNLDITSINRIIDPIDMIRKISQIMRKHKNIFYFPFSLIYNNFEEILKYLNFKYYHKDGIITLSFQIPFYKKEILHHVLRKPMMINNMTYFLKDIGEYVIFAEEKTMFYSLAEYEAAHFVSKGQDFCERMEFNSLCENELINSQAFSPKCLKRMNKTNVVTKIDLDLYFMVFTPLIIDVSCETNKFKIRLETHTKITNNIACSMNSSTFVYDPKNSSTYDIYFLEDENSTWHFDEANIYEILILIGGIIMSNMMTIFYYLKNKYTEEKFKDIDLQSDKASSIHMYATINEL